MKPTMTFTNGKVTIDVPYVSVFVEEIKTIPSHFRTYDPAKHIWTVFQPHVATARRITRRYFPDVEEIGVNNFEQEQERQRKANEDFAKNQKARDEQRRQRQQRQRERDRQYQQNRQEYQDPFRDFFGGSQRRSHASGNGHATGPVDDYAVLYVARNAPKEVIDAAYKALSKLHHPDKGGDPETMKKINAAYDRVKVK